MTSAKFNKHSRTNDEWDGGNRGDWPDQNESLHDRNLRRGGGPKWAQAKGESGHGNYASAAFIVLVALLR